MAFVSKTAKRPIAIVGYVRLAGRRKKNAGKALYGSFLDPPKPSVLLRQLLAGRMPFKNAANTSVVWHHGKLLALWEGGAPHELDVPGLKTIGPYDFQGKLKHAFTAHPKIDITTGEMMCHGYWPMKPYLQYSVVNKAGAIVHSTPIELPRAVMMHDAAITERYTIFLDLPLTLDLMAAAKGEELGKFRPELGARIGVLPRYGKGSEIKWYSIKPCFVFHVLNAFEHDGKLSVFACRMEKYPEWVSLTKSAKDLSLTGYADPPRMHRWTVDLKSGKVNESTLDEQACEFPRVDDRLTGKQTRFGYSLWNNEKTSGVLKFDLEKNSKQLCRLGDGVMCGEWVFVPRSSETKSEDDGWLVTYVHDRKSDRSEFVVLNAADVTAKPVARVVLPQRVPSGFHAVWIDGKQLQAS